MMWKNIQTNILKFQINNMELIGIIKEIEETKTFGSNDLYCEGCVKNSSTDPSFINPDNSYMKAPPLLN